MFDTSITRYIQGLQSNTSHCLHGTEYIYILVTYLQITNYRWMTNPP